MSDRTRETEEAVIVGLLHDPRRLHELSGFDPAWFTIPECKLLYWLAATYHAEAQADGKVRYAVPGVLKHRAESWVKKSPKEKQKGRAAALKAALALMDESRDPESDDAFKAAADEVRETAMDRTVCDGILKISEGRRAGADPRGMTRQLRDLVSRVQMASRESTAGTLERDAAATLADYEKAKGSQNRGFIPTPFREINQACGGGRYGRLWLCCGYAKDGKTRLASELVYHAIRRKFGAVVISGEQTKSDLRDMFVCRHSHLLTPGGLPLDKITNGGLDAAQEKALSMTIKSLTSGRYGPLTYDEQGGATVSEIRSMAEAAARRHRVDVIMVDHTDLFEPSERQTSDNARQGRILKELKKLSLDFLDGRGVWVIVCHQIKREGYDAGIKRGFYVASDCAGTAEAERSCDVMTWIMRDEKMREMSEARVGVAVDRRGPGIPRGFACYERFESAALLEIED